MSKKAVTSDTDSEQPAKAETSILRFTATAHLCENGEHYKPDETLFLSAARAAALGSLVKPAEAE